MLMVAFMVKACRIWPCLMHTAWPARPPQLMTRRSNLSEASLNPIMTRLSWDKHCASRVRSLLLQVLRVKLNSCLLIAGLLMGLCSQKGGGGNNDILLFFLWKRNSDDDSGKINLQVFWGGALQKIAVSFTLTKKIKAWWLVVLIGVSYRDSPGFHYWNVLGNKAGGNMRLTQWQRQKQCWNTTQSMAEKLSPGAKHKAAV